MISWPPGTGKLSSAPDDVKSVTLYGVVPSNETETGPEMVTFDEEDCEDDVLEVVDCAFVEALAALVCETDWPTEEAWL